MLDTGREFDDPHVAVGDVLEKFLMDVFGPAGL